MNFPAGGVASENRARHRGPRGQVFVRGVGDEAEDEAFGYSKARTTTQYGPIYTATRRAGANFPDFFVARR